MQTTEKLKLIIYTIQDQPILDQLQHYDVDGVSMSFGEVLIPSFALVPNAIQKTRTVRMSSFIPQTEEFIPRLKKNN